MMNSKIWTSTTLAAAGGLIAGWFLGHKNDSQPPSIAECFLGENNEENPTLATYKNFPVHLNSLPSDLKKRLHEAQIGSYNAAQQVFEEYAVRKFLAPDAQAPDELPTLATLTAKSVSDEELRNFYTNNKNSFGGGAFETVAPALRKHIEERRSQVFFQEKLQEIQKNNMLVLFAPIPCGAKGNGEAPQGVLYSGNKKAPISINLFTNYSAQGRIIEAKTLDVVKKHNAVFKLVVHPVPEANNAVSASLVKGFWCAQKKSDDAAIAFQQRAQFSPLGNAAERMSNEFANSVVAQVATQANVNDESFQNCLASTDLENHLKNITENTEKYGAKNENALFVNNREIIISKMLNVEVTLNSIAAEYLKR